MEERAPTLYRGLAASGGLVFAAVVRFEAKKVREAPRYEVPSEEANAEIARFYTALDKARRELVELAKVTEFSCYLTSFGYLHFLRYAAPHSLISQLGIFPKPFLS